MPTTHHSALPFDLLIDPHGDGYCARVINGPAGEEQHEFALPFDLAMLRAWLPLPEPLYAQLRLSPTAANTFAPPILPMRFYGHATFNADNIPAGAPLSTEIGQQVRATTIITIVGGISSYVIDIPGDDPSTPNIEGGRDGDEVHFIIPGYIANQRGV